MPEGDTIFRAARTLHRALAGKVVTRFETQYAQIARVHDDAPITGRLVEKVEARGKHLLMHFSPRTDAGAAVVLRTHMLMSGSWHIYRTGERWQRSPVSARVIVGTADFVAVGFSVPVAEFVQADDLDTDEALSRLGPDVLATDFDGDVAHVRLATSTRPTVAEALLQQQAVAGIGNVFKSELLFLAGVWPFLPPASVTDAHWARMLRDARALLKANVLDPADTGVLTWRGMRRTTGRMHPGQRLYVYGRHGKPCRRCGTTIEMRHHGEHNRSTYWCPACQPAPATPPPR
jgi:endonuclease-8